MVNNFLNVVISCKLYKVPNESYEALEERNILSVRIKILGEKSGRRTRTRRLTAVTREAADFVCASKNDGKILRN